MYANPKETTSLRLDGTMKRRSRELLALHGMTLTEAFEEYMDELVYRDGPPMRASREAKASTTRIRFEAFMESGSGAGEEGEHPREGGRKMSCSAKTRKLSVRIDADLKAAFEGTLRGIGVDPTCAMRSFAFQIVLEGSIPFDPVDAGFEASGKTAVTSAKIPEDVAGEMESVLKGLGTNFSQVVRLLALQTTALGGMPFAAGIPREAS